MRFTDVYMIWSDWEETVESFKNEKEFFEYMRTMQEEEGYEIIDFHSENPNWSF